MLPLKIEQNCLCSRNAAVHSACEQHGPCFSEFSCGVTPSQAAILESRLTDITASVTIPCNSSVTGSKSIPSTLSDAETTPTTASLSSTATSVIVFVSIELLASKSPNVADEFAAAHTARIASISAAVARRTDQSGGGIVYGVLKTSFQVSRLHKILCTFAIATVLSPAKSAGRPCTQRKSKRLVWSSRALALKHNCTVHVRVPHMHINAYGREISTAVTCAIQCLPNADIN